MSENGVSSQCVSSVLVRVPDSIMSSASSPRMAPSTSTKRVSISRDVGRKAAKRVSQKGNATWCSSVPVPDPAVSSSSSSTSKARRISLVESSARRISLVEDDVCGSKVLGGEMPVSINDVLCMRGPTAFHHVGNRRFRVRVELNLKAYFQREFQDKRNPTLASAHDENDNAASDDADWRDHKRKSRIVDEVIETIHQGSPPGRFLVKEESTGALVVASPETARLKVEQTFSAAGRFLGLIEGTATAADNVDTDAQTHTLLKTTSEEKPKPSSPTASCEKQAPKLSVKDGSPAEASVPHRRDATQKQRKRKSVQFKPGLAAILSQAVQATADASQSSPSTTIISDKAFTSINDNDVICETDPRCFNNIGNRRFRVLVEAGVSTYCRAAAKERIEDEEAIQSYVVQRVIAAVQSSFHPFPGRFLQLDKEHKIHPKGAENKERWPWRIMTPKEAQDKTQEVFQTYATILPHLRYKYKDKKRRKMEQQIPSNGSSACLWMSHDGWGTTYNFVNGEPLKEERSTKKEGTLSDTKEGASDAVSDRKGMKRHHPGKSNAATFNLVENAASSKDEDDNAITDNGLSDKDISNHRGRMVQTFRDPDDTTRLKVKLQERKITQTQENIMKCFGDTSVAMAAAEDAKARANAVRDRSFGRSFPKELASASPQRTALDMVLRMAAEETLEKGPSSAKRSSGTHDKIVGAAASVIPMTALKKTKKKTKVAHPLSSHETVSDKNVTETSHNKVSSSKRNTKRISIDMGECVKYAKLQTECVADDAVDSPTHQERKETTRRRVSSSMTANSLPGGEQIENFSKETTVSRLQSQTRTETQAQLMVQKLSNSKGTSSPPKPEVVPSNSSSSSSITVENGNKEETVEQLQERAKMLLLKRQWTSNKATDRLLPTLEAYQKATLCSVYGAAGASEGTVLQKQHHKKAQNAAQMLSIGSTKNSAKSPPHKGAGICLSGLFSVNTKKESDKKYSTAQERPLENLSALQEQAKSLLKKRQYEPTPEPRFDSHPRMRVSNKVDLVKSSQTPQGTRAVSTSKQAPDKKLPPVEKCPPPPSFNPEQVQPLPSSPPSATTSPPLEPAEAWVARKRRSLALPLPQEVKLTKKATPPRVLQSIEGQYDDAENDTIAPRTERTPRPFHDEVATQQPTGLPGCPARRLSDAIGGILMMTTRKHSDVDVTGFGDVAEEKAGKYLKTSKLHDVGLPESSLHSMQKVEESDPSKDAEQAVIEAMLAVRYRGKN